MHANGRLVGSVSTIIDIEEDRAPRLWSRPSVRFRANCGCGFVAQTPAQAANHADSVGHTLTISGEVRVEKYK